MKHLYLLAAFVLLGFNLSAQDPAGWRYHYIPYYRTINAVHVIDTNTIVVAGGNRTNDKIRTICRTQDGGYNWDIIIDSLDASWLTSMWFVNPFTGFAAGHEGLLLKTTDGGQNWSHITLTGNAGTRNYNSIFFTDAQTGFLAGGNETNDSIQTILKTTDGGDTWSIQRDIPGYWLKTIYFTDANNGYATGTNGVALKTTDGGDTWNQMPLPGSVAARTCNTIAFIDANIGFLGGGNELNDSIQTILKTTDAGASWNIIRDSIAPWINSIQFITSNTGFAVGDDGTVLVSNDAGNTWNSAGVPDSVDGGFSHHRAVHFQGADFGVVAGTFGKVMVYNAPAPTGAIVTTDVATNTSTTSVTFNGSVNANGSPTTASFEYWSGTGNVNTVEAHPDSLFGNTLTAVSATVTGLNSNTLYYFRAKAGNATGTSYGNVRQIFVGENPIPNWDFEIWDTVERFVPQRWISTGDITQVASYDGTHATGIQGGSRDFGAIFFGAPGDNGFTGGVPLFARPDSLIGHFNYDVAAGDSALIILFFKKNGVYNSQQFYHLTGSSGGSFQRLSFPITYSNGIQPDSVILGITSSDPVFDDTPDPTSFVAVDNISFSGTNLNVPNNNFESWYTDSIETLLMWTGRYDAPVSGLPPAIIKTTDNQHGNFAAKLENTAGTDAARIETGDDIPAFVVHEKHNTFNFYAKYFPGSGDTLDVFVNLYADGQRIAYASLLTSTGISEYTPVILPLIYSVNQVPDSANIAVRLGTISPAAGGSELYIDNMSFDGFYGSTGVVQIKGKPELPWHVYPNPAHDAVTVRGMFDKEENAILAVLNINGATMYKQNISLPPGHFEAKINIENFPNGIYLITLQMNGEIQFRRLVVSK